MNSRRSLLVGCGAYLPERILENSELAKIVDTSDDWIIKRTGIRQRHVAADGEFTSDLAIRAAHDDRSDRLDCGGHNDTRRNFSLYRY